MCISVFVKGVNYSTSRKTYTTQDPLRKEGILTSADSAMIVEVDVPSFSLSNSIMDLNKCVFTNCSAVKGASICNLGAMTQNNITFNDLPEKKNVFWDYDKYRDEEYK